MADRFHILSLDGGGLKGLFTASFLANWENQTGEALTDHFDLIVGTSTGGIIALALGLGLPAMELVKFYRDEAKVIFPESALGDLKHWVRVKHSAEGLEKVLKKYFGDRTLGESRRPLVIPAYYAKRHEIYLFKTPHHERLRYDWKEKAIDVARATAAAPTYLEPFQKESGLQLIDGGMFANNPVMIGVAEALGYLNRPQESIGAVRIGTTSEVVRMNAKPEQGGKLVMAAPVIDYMMAGQELSASGMVKHILGKDRFHEVNPVAAPNEFALDKLSQELTELGEHEFRKHCSDLADKGFLEHKPAEYKPYYP